MPTCQLNCLCHLLVACHIWCKQQFVFGMIFANKETTANAFRMACLPSASPAGPRIYPTMQRALGLFWSLTSSCFRAILTYFFPQKIEKDTNFKPPRIKKFRNFKQPRIYMPFYSHLCATFSFSFLLLSEFFLNIWSHTFFYFFT